MLIELGVAVAVASLMTSGHTPTSAARIVGRVAGKAAGSIRRVRAEATRMQQRAQAAGGSELRESSAELSRKLQQLRMVQQETSALLRVRPSTLLTPDGKTIDVNASEFSDEELYDALRTELFAKAGLDASSLPSGVPTIPAHVAQPAVARDYSATPGAAYTSNSSGHSSVMYSSPMHGSPAPSGMPVGGQTGTASRAAWPAHGQAQAYGSNGPSVPSAASGGGHGSRGASMMADMLRWETVALQQEMARAQHYGVPAGEHGGGGAGRPGNGGQAQDGNGQGQAAGRGNRSGGTVDSAGTKGGSMAISSGPGRPAQQPVGQEPTGGDGRGTQGSVQSSPGSSSTAMR